MISEDKDEPSSSTYITVTLADTDGTARKLASSQSRARPWHAQCPGTEPTTEQSAYVEGGIKVREGGGGGGVERKK